MATANARNYSRRRSNKELDAEGYARGWSEGREQGRSESEQELFALQRELAGLSLRKLAWSRLTGLFKAQRHDF
jgi:flagellar biosynthesis/type III secretory pathway protein FliH